MELLRAPVVLLAVAAAAVGAAAVLQYAAEMLRGRRGADVRGLRRLALVLYVDGGVRVAARRSSMCCAYDSVDRAPSA